MQTANAVNGASILARFPVAKGWIIFAYWKTAEYVTWLCDDSGNACWGHYYRNYENGKADFLRRAERGY